MMTKKLGVDDSQAVDLLLDQVHILQRDSGSAYMGPVSDSVLNRIGAVETVLRVLAEMPASDPPADLVERTMLRIERAVAEAPVVADDRPRPPVGDGPQHA